MMRVLIVEDEKPIREMLDDFLTDEGFDTLLAENGQDGLDVARAEHPDLILMDLMLPLLDGIAAVRALRDDLATRHIPIVVMSANSILLTNINEQRLAVETIRKPFDLDEVLDVIRTQSGVSQVDQYWNALPEPA